jgi:cation:H+ antiporter
MIIWILVFVASLTALIFSANYFIRAAERLGIAMGIPPFIVGVTVLALGTSLPELITSIVSVINDSSEIVVGNIIGSNIANICLILGLMGVISGSITTTFDPMKVDLPLMIGATFFMGLAIMDGDFAIYELVIALLGIGLYLMYFIQSDHSEGEEVKTGGKIRWTDPLILVASIVGLYFSADYNVESIIEIATRLDIGKEVVALSAVALGTSLPELIVSIVALRKRQADMAIGNIIGSNIFNIFAVLGIPALFGKLIIPDSILTFSFPLLLAVSLLCFFIFQNKNINRWTGGILLLFYFFFMSQLITSAV